MLLRILSACALLGGFVLPMACSRAAHRVQSVSASRGSAIFAAQCAACHGPAGAGGPVGPSLREARESYRAIVEAIEQPTPPMPKLFPAQLSHTDVADVAAYVQSL